MHFFIHLAFLSSALHHVRGSPINSNDLIDGLNGLKDAITPPIEYLEEDQGQSRLKGDIVIRLPKELGDKANKFYSDKLDDCPAKKKRSLKEDCLYEDAVATLENIRRGGELGDMVNYFWNTGNLPALIFDDEAVEQAYLRFFMYAYDIVERMIPDNNAANDLIFNPVISMVFIMGAHSLYKNFYVNGELHISGKGFVRKKKDDEKPNCQDLNSAFAPKCPEEYCKGENGKCTTTEFKDCDCVPTNCPDPEKLLYRCEDCDGKRGICQSKDKANCHCVHEATIFVNPGTKEQWELRQKILDGLPKYDPKKEQEEKEKEEKEKELEGKLLCKKKETSDLGRKPELWKFVQQKGLDEDIKSFCKEFKDVDGKGGAGSKSSFFRQGDLNEVDLKIEYEEGAKVTAHDCEVMLGKISSECDWDPKSREESSNYYNWKWGGEITKNKVKYQIEPIANRVAQEKRKDGSHWVDVKTAKPTDETRKNVKSGKEWDLLILHQCLHGMKEEGWTKGKKFDCAGIVEFTMAAHWTYFNSNDCFDNTWDMLSWNIVHEGGFNAKAIHKAGKTAGTLTKCWLWVRG